MRITFLFSRLDSRRASATARLTAIAGLLLALPTWAAALLDPTQPYGSAERAAPAPSGLQSTIIGPDFRRAVIDGRVYHVGDRYQGAIVKEIRSYEVILNEAGKVRRLRLVPSVKQHSGAE